ncbi:maleylacetoacetate isomerase-like protein [Sarcoptes scabiei]|uniref:maleylacetoacetate isomerase n=1 Tax=Sarcoptes scabiei TaxID=52283 RepID=A0A131ZZ36_SARSC|nr:maleylacetoacetate isomerase-like protein [Sarcoptes scabiei]
MPSKFVLFSYWRSSCSWRIRALLEYKRIPYEYRAINLLNGEQFSPEFLRINPLGLVPALQFQTEDGRTEIISESMAIVDYLEHIVPEPSIFPKDPIERAKVIAVAEAIVSGIQPVQNLGVMKLVEQMTGSKEKSLEWSNKWIAMKFKRLELMLKSTAGKYCFGDRLTLADICLVPQIANAIRYRVDLDEFPLLKQLNETLLSCECFQKSRPENQPDQTLT